MCYAGYDGSLSPAESSTVSVADCATAVSWFAAVQKIPSFSLLMKLLSSGQKKVCADIVAHCSRTLNDHLEERSQIDENLAKVVQDLVILKKLFTV